MAIQYLQSSDPAQQQGVIGTVVVPLSSLTEEDGTPLVKLTGTTSGLSQPASKEIVLSMPINATIEAFQATISLPADLDSSEDVTAHVLVGKDADNDTLTLDCEVYPCAVGDTGNADIQDTAAQAITEAAVELVFTCGSDGVLSAPGSVTAIFTLGGTNDGDAVYVYAVWFEYTCVVAFNPTPAYRCRTIVPYAHKLNTASLHIQNLVTTGTVTVTLKQTDPGDSRGGAAIGTALNNTSLALEGTTNRCAKIDFELDAEDLLTAPANRMYFVVFTSTDPADRVDEPVLVVGVDVGS